VKLNSGTWGSMIKVVWHPKLVVRISVFFQNRFKKIEKHSKGELEAKAQKLNEKVNNQKNRIIEQQAQIEVCFPPNTQTNGLRAWC
jgi:hypothetical protein